MHLFLLSMLCLAVSSSGVVAYTDPEKYGEKTPSSMEKQDDAVRSTPAHLNCEKTLIKVVDGAVTTFWKYMVPCVQQQRSTRPD